MNLYSNNFKLISIGNKKINSNTIILNCSSYANCSSKKLGLCPIADKCYARKAEYLYPCALPYRDRQEKYILESSLYRMLIDFHDTLKIGNRANKIKYLRLNEVGDFQNSEIIIKLNELACNLKLNYGIITYTYTHRKDLIKTLEKAKYINIIGSGFEVNGNIAEVFDYKENYSNIPKGYHICDCRKNSKIKKTCNLNCFFCSSSKKNKKLALIKH
jgi:hypothetical protein